MRNDEEMGDWRATKKGKSKAKKVIGSAAAVGVRAAAKVNDTRSGTKARTENKNPLLGFG